MTHRKEMTTERFRQCRVCNHHFIYLATFYDGMDRGCAIREARKIANTEELVNPAYVRAVLDELDDTQKNFDEEISYATGEIRDLEERAIAAEERYS